MKDSRALHFRPASWCASDEPWVSCAVRLFPFAVNEAIGARALILGVVDQIGEVVMAKIIEFYVPERFRKETTWIPADRRGKVINFIAPAKKSA